MKQLSNLEYYIMRNSVIFMGHLIVLLDPGYSVSKVTRVLTGRPRFDTRQGRGFLYSLPNPDWL
jgi:hypothetical protein